MPLPMIHLAVGVQVCQLSRQALTPAFLLGSIAPDAIHMRPGAQRDDKTRTHLWSTHNEAGDPAPIRELLTRPAEGQPGPDFLAGYAAHLLADRAWAEALIKPFRSGHPQDMPEPALRRLYYRETDWIDLELYRRLPWRAQVWAHLAAANSPGFPPLLTAGEIGGWRDRTLRWYDQDQAALSTPAFITYDKVEAFIAEAAQVIAGRFSAWQADHDPAAASGGKTHGN